MSKNISLLILSCDKFSDLWDGHIKLLEQNWPNREMETYIITDAPTEKKYAGIHILSAGNDVQWSDRLAFALKQVNTEYIFVTLDDYYLVKKVNDDDISELTEMMEKEKIDYVRLFPKPERATMGVLKGYPYINWIDKSIMYCVNLYSGIWKKDFLESTCDVKMNAWQYEVTLAKRAREYDARCVVSKKNEFVILDVVRKGKLLHKAVSYFEKHPGIYEGNRPINSYLYEIKLNIQIFMADHLPLWAHKPVKRIMNLFGKEFFSDSAEI